MLDQLVESKSNSRENKRRSEFLMVTMVIMVTLLVVGWTYSLFAKDFGMGGDDLALTTLVAPVLPEEAPPPKPEEQKKAPDADVRKELVLDVNMSPKIPDKISVEKNTIPPIRDKYNYKIGDTNSNATEAAPGVPRQVDTSTPGGLGDSSSKDLNPTDETPVAPPVKKLVPKTVSGGVLNGKATSLPKPAYPPAARAVRAGGSVNVQVLIDESGRVVSASAVSGHPLLRAAAEGAARGARFSPTLLSGQPVKVSGLITYNFVP